MADESHVIRGIDWKTTFPFTQIFRSFRIAIHPCFGTAAAVSIAHLSTAAFGARPIVTSRYAQIPSRAKCSAG